MSELAVRVAKVEDAEEILNIYAYYVRDTAITFEYEVPSLEDFQGRIQGTLQRYPYLVACKDGKTSAMPMRVLSRNGQPMTGRSK